ncbi:IMCp domain-containing protein [Stratiformator vulcanicus]|nr:IMCp domain-containing protein [Stratiformator vulcanicus]
MGRHTIKSFSAAFAIAAAMVTASVAVTDIAFAQGWTAPGSCCGTCGEIVTACTCTRMQPVCETTVRRQDCVTWREVPRTLYRDEEYVVTIPKIDYDCVTVDEGCYKMVWVPKPVKKVIPKTVYQKDIRTRKVPFTVSQKVPVVSSQWIPEKRVRCVPQTTTQYYRQPFGTNCPPITAQVPPLTGFGGGYGAHGGYGVHGGFGAAGGFGAVAPQPYGMPGGCPNGQCGMNHGAGAFYGNPGYQPTPAPVQGPVPNPTPDNFDDPAAWSNVPSRAAVSPQMFPHMAAQYAQPMPNHYQQPAQQAAHYGYQAAQYGYQAARQPQMIQQAGYAQPQTAPMQSAYRAAYGQPQPSAIQQVGYSR